MKMVESAGAVITGASLSRWCASGRDTVTTGCALRLGFDLRASGRALSLAQDAPFDSATLSGQSYRWVSRRLTMSEAGAK
jgi:hypothetical protein